MVDKLIFNGGLLNLSESEYERNLEYAQELYESYLSGLEDLPMVGEIIKKKDGTFERITVTNNESVQSYGSLLNYGFYLSERGYSSYSGICGDSIKNNNLKLSNETEFVRFWFFNVCTIEKAHQGIHFDMPVRIWEEI